MPDPILKSLHEIPKSGDLYLWCDFIELRCLTHVDKRFSRQNLIEILDETKGLGIRADSQGADESAEDDSEENEDEGDDDVDAGEISDADIAEALPKSDKNEARVADLFSHLQIRLAIFDDAYPFHFDAGTQEIVLTDVLNPRQYLYLELLLSSSLRLVSKTRRKELTEAFETISTHIFKGLMPPDWEVHQFGAKASTRYRGHLFTRLQKLAKDWRGTHRLKKRDYTATNSGDGGLDIVAWHPMGNDNREGIPIAAAQCGCTATEWSLKQLEASPSKLAITVQHKWVTYYFMPQDLVAVYDGENDWQRKNWLAECIVVDRLRIIRLAKQFGVDALFAAPSVAVQEARALAVA